MNPFFCLYMTEGGDCQCTGKPCNKENEDDYCEHYAEMPIYNGVWYEEDF